MLINLFSIFWRVLPWPLQWLAHGLLDFHLGHVVQDMVGCLFGPVANITGGFLGMCKTGDVVPPKSQSSLDTMVADRC